MNLILFRVLVLFFVMTPGSCYYAQIKDISPILPSPVVYKRAKGNLYLPKKISLNKEAFPEPMIAQLDTLLEKIHALETVDTRGKAFIRLRKLKNVPKDFYSIAINDYVFISYSNEKSLFYALESFIQLIQTEEDIKYIPKAFIQDYPKFEWRGLHLDVSRHFFTVAELKKYLDIMAFYKLNIFHWHLTDDQGWRIEIKAFPKLTSIGAWRDSTIINHFTSEPRQYDNTIHGGYYTQEEVKEIIKYAQERYITIVPEIEMPGHSSAALAAYPEYSCNQKKQSVPGVWGVFDNIYCTKEETFVFLETILEEITELFPGDYIHIGGDEAPKTNWEYCINCQKTIQDNALLNEKELQSYFIKRIDRFLLKKNKKLLGWDEILEGGLSPNAAVMSWRGMQGGIIAAKKSHYVVMTPGSHCYFDHYQSKSKSEPLAIGGYTSLEKVYNFNPIPSGLNSTEASFILGGQANLWTEYIPDMNQLEYMAYPRAIALSQSLWCTDKPEFKSFSKMLYTYHFPLLDILEVNYSNSSLKPSIDFIGFNKGIRIKVNSKDSSDVFQTNISEDGISKNKTFTLKANHYFDVQAKKENTVKTTITFKNLKNSITSNVTLKNHLGLGAKITFETAPNPQYNYTQSVLTDGQYGMRPWRGHEWIGFDSDNIVFEIEFEKKKKIKTVNFSFLKSNGSWIYLPNELEIYKPIRKREKLFAKSTIKTEQTEIKINRRIRKLRFKISTYKEIPIGLPGEGHTPWTFLDEIEFN
jgi:hexosaminidase